MKFSEVALAEMKVTIHNNNHALGG
jgi:hypothetical protein